MKFSIVILTHDQIEQSLECIKSIQAVKPREFPDKQIFIVHNGSRPEIVNDLRTRFPRFHHVVLSDNEGFTVGANAGLRAAFQLQPWALFMTQDTSLVHFPKSMPFEPCMAAVKVYKRKLEVVGSVGGAVDLELARHYYCTKSEMFWNAFESPILHAYVPRTAFWMHQGPFEKVNGFDENMGAIWEDVDISLRLRAEGEMLQLDDTTEVIHHRKGFSRRDPVQTKFLYHRNRYAISRRQSRNRGQKVLFELNLFVDWIGVMLGSLSKPSDLTLIFKAYRHSFARPLVSPRQILLPQPAPPPEKVEEHKAEIEPAAKATKKSPKKKASTEKKAEVSAAAQASALDPDKSGLRNIPKDVIGIKTNTTAAKTQTTTEND